MIEGDVKQLTRVLFSSNVDYHGVDVALFRSAQVDFFNTKQNTSNSPVQFCPFPVYPG